MKLKVISSPLCGKLFVCPTVYKTDNNSYVIRGKVVDEKIKSELNIPPKENLVEIPAEFFNKIIHDFTKNKKRKGGTEKYAKINRSVFKPEKRSISPRTS